MLLEQMEFWHWWVFAIILIILEMFVSGTFFLWMGISAILVGAVFYVFADMTWEYQWLIFAVFSVVSITLWRVRQQKHPTETDHPTLNRRGAQYVGRVFTLTEPIIDGVGKIRVDDSTWKISGEDCDAGAKVRVVDVDGTILKVKHE